MLNVILRILQTANQCNYEYETKEIFTVVWFSCNHHGVGALCLPDHTGGHLIAEDLSGAVCELMQLIHIVPPFPDLSCVLCLDYF